MTFFGLRKLPSIESLRYVFAVMVIFMSFGAFLIPLGSIAQQDDLEPPETVEVSSPSRYTFRVRLSELADLKVKEGDAIDVGQVIADRSQDRDRLLVEKQRLELAITRLESHSVTPPLAPRPVPNNPALPSVNYDTYTVDIAQRITQLELAQQAIADQESLIQEISLLNEPLLVVHEKAKLEKLKVDAYTAQLDLDKAQANLKNAQAQREHQEYLSSLAIAYKSHQSEAFHSHDLSQSKASYP